MKYSSCLLLSGLLISTHALASEYQDISQFAQDICGDIPEGTLSKTTIKGAVEANAGLLTKILSGGANASAETVHQTYKGIPLDKLPDNIPTVSMCKSELVKAIFSRKKEVANTCRHPDFGQTGWNRQEVYTDSSGRLGGGHDQNWWCNQVASSFIGSRGIGPQNQIERVASNEEHHRDWRHHDEYKYHCTLKISWEPIYLEKQDASHCGTHEE